MKKNVLIIVSGPPGSGKTTLATALSEQFGAPVFAKDSIKEALFDTLGVGDREWSRQLGAASMELLYRLMEQQLRAGALAIVEANFKGTEAEARISALCGLYSAHTVQIACSADEEVLNERVKERWESGRRHRGHCDSDFIGALRPGWLVEQYAPLNFGGSTHAVETTDLSRIDYDGLFNEVKRQLATLRVMEPSKV